MKQQKRETTGYGDRLNRVTFSLLAFVLCLPSQSRAGEKDTITRIALGSCADQRKKPIIWDAIVAQNPELFVFLGDNVYADTDQRDEFREAYGLLAEKSGYQALKELCPIIAIWDDHDYGVNDGGAEFAGKELAEEMFHEFFETPADAPVRSYPGIYDVKYYGEKDGERLQVILLDTRYFRSELVELPKRSKHGPYGPNEDPEATILGDAQWQWLETQLREPADIRIIASSIQVLPEDHHWELWANFPLERKKLFDLLDETETGPVLFVSGDRHMGEISKLKRDDPNNPGFPLYEMTTSGLTNAGGGRSGEPNRHRVSPTNFQSRNFGMIEIDWDDRSLRLELRDVEGEVVDSYEANLDAGDQ